MLSGVGGWAGIGLAGGLLSPENAAAWHGAVDQGRKQGDETAQVGTAGLGAVGGYAGLAELHHARRPADRVRPAGLIDRQTTQPLPPHGDPHAGNFPAAAALNRRGPGHGRTCRVLGFAMRNPRTQLSRRNKAAPLCPWRSNRKAVHVSSQRSSGGDLDLAAPVGDRHCRGAGHQGESRRRSSRRTASGIDADGNPTFHIGDDGSVDWYTFSGYRRYHSDCHVCHGPDGVGSSYAPALAELAEDDGLRHFLSIVAEGRKNVGGGKENVMPAFGDNKNVYCYLDDLYVYLRARAVDAIPRGRPPKKDDKPQAAKDHEKECMGG